MCPAPQFIKTTPPEAPRHTMSRRGRQGTGEMVKKTLKWTQILQVPHLFRNFVVGKVK